MSLFEELDPVPDFHRYSTGVTSQKNSPSLAVRMRPESLEELLGQDPAVSSGSPLRSLVEGNMGMRSSIVLWGPPGSGKTTVVHLIARAFESNFVELSAVSDGAAALREVLKNAKERSGRGVDTLLFVDEVHRFNKAQQDILLPAVENSWVTLIAATTENPSFSVIPPLLSRSLVVQLNPLSENSLKEVVKKALVDPRGLDGAYEITEEALENLVRFAGGDARKALTLLDAATVPSTSRITTKELSQVSNGALVRWGKGERYDVISAFIKSMRGGDPDATLHYLARMLHAGEDPKFISRRIMIAASEDVGLADSSVLVVANSADQAVSRIGLPEAKIILAHAALAVALAPKSNSAYKGIEEALSDVQRGKIGTVPQHLRDNHYQDADEYGSGVGYIYPHDIPGGVVEQQYLPDKLRSAEYYRPSKNGREGRKYVGKLD